MIGELALVDHHCHGVVPSTLDRRGFEDLITESAWPAPQGTSHFQAPLGLALLHHCAPLLDLEPPVDPDAYLERRAELGTGEVNRRLLAAAGLGALLIETGYRAGDLLDPGAMAEAAGAPAFEVVRLEAVAEAVARTDPDAARYPDAFAERLEEAARGAVGLKTIAAYRGGFAFDPAPPSRDEVVGAAGRWLAEAEEGRARLADPTLIRFGIWTGAELARDRRLPLQFHVGYGDPDLTLHLTDPSLLTDLIRRLRPLGVTVALLHCYPYHRQAAYLAAVFPHVVFDVGLAITYTGPGVRRLLAEALELAPFTKQLYSSDAFGLPELFYLGARAFRAALGEILAEWVARRECSPAEAERIARLIGAENARRLYPLEER